MMHHPRPQHPPSTPQFGYNLYEAQQDQHSFSRSVISDVRAFGLPPYSSTQAENSEMVEPPQYAYPPQSLAQSMNYGSIPAQRSQTTYHDFQSPSSNSHSHPPPQNPAYAPRPANVANVFSHIEHPKTSSSDSTEPLSSGDEKDRITPHDPHRHTRNTSRSENSHGYIVAYDSGSQTTLNGNVRIDRSISHATSNPYALNPVMAPEVEMKIGALRPISRRPRGRHGSESSMDSMVSDAAVFGDTIYRTDTVYNTMSARSNRAAGSHFQLPSAPASYPHEYSNSSGGFQPQENVPRIPRPAGFNIDIPYIPPSPRDSNEPVDHPFVYKGTEWDYRLRSLQTAPASTRSDAMSLDGRERRSSSRGGTEDHPPRKDRRTTQALESPAYLNSEGKKKTTMACHFCRHRKLRCDGGLPCGHCEKKDKECIYDDTIRRRGPGRKNKSAQETAKVQLAQRQREEADREARINATKHKVPFSVSAIGAPTEKKDVSMQTSPEVGRYHSVPRDNRRYATPSEYATSPPSQRTIPTNQSSCPANQKIPSSVDRSTSALRSSIEVQMSFYPSQDPSQDSSRARERRAYPMPFTHDSEVYPASLAQQSQPYISQHYGEPSQGRDAYGPRTPVSVAPTSFYDGSPDRRSSSNTSQQACQYSPSGYSQGGGYRPNQYQSDTQTDTESMYAYSEGANVMPSRYGDQSQIPPAPRSDVQMPYGRDWDKSLPRDPARR